MHRYPIICVDIIMVLHKPSSRKISQTQPFNLSWVGPVLPIRPVRRNTTPANSKLHPGLFTNSNSIHKHICDIWTSRRLLRTPAVAFA